MSMRLRVTDIRAIPGAYLTKRLPHPDITLASASPRRRELLALTGWEFRVCSSTVSETPFPGEAPPELAQRLARSKAKAARATCPTTDVTVGADTIVVDRQEIMGKPEDRAEAAAMLQRLRGRGHSVITAVALDTGAEAPLVELCESRVPMRDYDQEQIVAYVLGGSPLDKAGAYGIQDPDLHPVDLNSFEDCYANVMGLPLCHLVRAFSQLGYEPPEDVPQRCKQFTGYDCTVYPTILRSGL
jgi:septum formation protein